MKKIYIALLCAILLASCGGKDVNTSTGSLDGTSSGTVMGTGTEDLGSTGGVVLPTIDNTGAVSNGTGSSATGDEKTEEEIVKDFESEIDSLFKLIEEDDKK